MDALPKLLAVMRRRLLLRQLAYAALFGLLAALLILAFAPWLGLSKGVMLVLPLALPAAAALFAWFRRPDEHTVVLAADRWADARGAVVAAWEQQRNGSPFAEAVARKALEKLGKSRVPSPAYLRYVLAALLVAGAMLPLSRGIEAQLLRAGEREQQRRAATLTDVNPDDARKIAEDARRVAEAARALGASSLMRLADDIANLAGDTEAAPRDKERALREANALTDRVQTQRETVRAGERARATLANEPMTAELASALDSLDSKRIDDAVDDLHRQLMDEYTDPASASADDALKAFRAAADAAPHNPDLRRALERLESRLGTAARDQRARRAQDIRESMLERRLGEEEILKALKQLEQFESDALRRALEGFADANNPLRDLGVGPRPELDPEEAQRLARLAGQLLDQLDRDTSVFAEMLRQGADFPGLEEFMRGTLDPGMSRPVGDGRESSPRRQAGAAPDLDFTDYADITPDTAATRDDGRMVELDPDSARDESAARKDRDRESTSRGIDTSGDIDRLPRRYQEAARRYFERD
jgi:hypothetical protein